MATIRALWKSAAMAAVAAGIMAGPAGAGVVVLANRTKVKVAFTITKSDGARRQCALDRGDVVPLPVASRVTVDFQDGSESRRSALEADGIYCFSRENDKLDLVRGEIANLANRSASASLPSNEAVCTIPVRILVDDKEPRLQRIWEKRYRERVAAASAIIERYCPVRFDVVAVGTWTSDDGAREMLQLIDEFERTVKVAPARLAIGFTGQYETLREDKTMGGIRRPFHPHILIREWGRDVVEPERLEILVHELGHFLGAVHSPEHQSVMRPDISDRQSRARDFRVTFDAPNTLVMYLVGEELRNRPLMHLCQLPLATRDSLRAVYASLAAALPTDTAARGYSTLLDQSPPAGSHSPPVVPSRD